MQMFSQPLFFSTPICFIDKISTCVLTAPPDRIINQTDKRYKNERSTCKAQYIRTIMLFRVHPFREHISCRSGRHACVLLRGRANRAGHEPKTHVANPKQHFVFGNAHSGTASLPGQGPRRCFLFAPPILQSDSDWMCGNLVLRPCHRRAQHLEPKFASANLHARNRTMDDCQRSTSRANNSTNAGHTHLE